MLIASWNVNSIRTRLSQVLDWIKSAKPDVVCLQETKVIDQYFPFKPFEDIGYEVKVYGQKTYNGVAILSRSPFIDFKTGFKGEIQLSPELKELEEQKRLISAYINGVRIINVYVPNGSSLNSDKYRYKIKWLNELSKYLKEQGKRLEPTCILGDFNIAPKNKDIHNPHKYEGNIMASKEERKVLKNLIGDRFIDSFRVFEESSGHWSWWDYRNNSFELNKGWRIDQIYISKNLLPKLKNSVIESSLRGNNQPSDHAPVMVELALNHSNLEFEVDDEDLFDL